MGTKQGMVLMMNNPPKFWLLVVTLLGVFALMAFGRIASDVGMGVVGTIVGYGVGNGIAAKNGDPVEPVFARKPADAGD